MRVGAASTLPPYLPKPGARPVPANAGDSPRDDSGRASAPVTALESSERTQQSDSQRFYSTDRTLPRSGQAAVALYLTNANLSWQPGESELLGIDLYV